MKTIHWGIIGCGEVTEVKSGPAFQQANNSQLVAVMRRNGALAQDYAHRHQVPKWYDNGAALINDPEIDAIYIATPPGSHQEYTLLATQAGKPVYVEKPMALNYGECQGMIEACRSVNVPLFTAYYRRSLPYFLKVKELLDSGVIGQVRFINSVLSINRTEDLKSPTLPWQLNPAISGGGWFIDMVCHNLDFLDYLFGPITEVHGQAFNQAGRYMVEDLVQGSFSFQSGVRGAGIWSFTSFQSLDRTEIIGETGVITFSTWSSNPITLSTTTGTEQFPIGFPPHVQLPHIQAIVNELNGFGHCPSTGESAARTSWVMDQFLMDYRGKY